MASVMAKLACYGRRCSLLGRCVLKVMCVYVHVCVCMFWVLTLKGGSAMRERRDAGEEGEVVGDEQEVEEEGGSGGCGDSGDCMWRGVQGGLGGQNITTAMHLICGSV